MLLRGGNPPRSQKQQAFLLALIQRAAEKNSSRKLGFR